MFISKVIDKAFCSETAKKGCYFISGGFCVIHIAYLFLFFFLNVKVMAYFNLFSITFYLASFYLIKEGRLKIFLQHAYVEIILHMALAIVCLGFGYGFEFCIIGTIVMLFFAEYFSKKLEANLHPIIANLITMGIFIGLFCYLYNNSPIYNSIKEWSYIVFFIIHTIVVFVLVIGLMAFLTEYAQLLERNNYLSAVTDNLTGILNRNGLFEAYDDYKEKNKSFLAIIDIDNFKLINDNYGHNCGDSVLKEIGEVIKNRFGDQIYCRWGGEEFVIISNRNNAVELFDSLREHIANMDFNYNNLNHKITVTIGVSKFNDFPNLESWVDSADRFLYIGKNSGKNKVVSQ